MAKPSTLVPEPYILAETAMQEFTVRAVVMGAVLGALFGASSLYLVLKVGLTVSASIPVAVISLALFRLWSKTGGRDSTILENNITQTAGSAGESIAFGVGVTMPAILILGFDLELTRVMLVSLLGGFLGILMMIPLRRALIVKEHGTLKYPEGVACAAVLKGGASAESRSAASPAAQREMHAARAAGLGESPAAKVIFSGFGIGVIYNVLNRLFKGWQDTPERIFGPPLNGGSLSIEVSAELLGVGYVIGPRIAATMCAGGMLSYLLLIPLIKFFGDNLSQPVPPGSLLISRMGPSEVRSAYILYVGAGAVAAGGIISLIRSAPTIWHGLKSGLSDFGASSHLQNTRTPRTDRDLPMKFVVIGVILLLAVVVLARPLHMNLLGAMLIVLFGFLFVTVSSRLTGEIGSSSNPISGMTVATLLFTCLIFLLVGWTGNTYYVTALSVGAIVCIAASNGGSTSQDLKTGFLLGATPKYQQISILVGAFVSALVLGPILLLLNNSGTVYVPVDSIIPAGLHVSTSQLQARDYLHGPQADTDGREYFVWHNTDLAGGHAGKYLVDDKGHAVYLVDPGINGVYKKRPDGTSVQKFTAPKATLISYIIQGILDRKLPWALVMLGVMISLTLEMSFIPALAFAVGVYLPLSSSTPLFIGGFVRWLVDRKMRRHPSLTELDDERFNEESDKGPGVMLASGYIAGGAIAGIAIAIGTSAFSHFNEALNDWSTAHNPFFAGPNADLLSLLPYGVICSVLYLVGRGSLLKGRANAVPAPHRGIQS